MGGYREKVDPTPEGLEELDESTRNATIERLIAAIQHKHLKPIKIPSTKQHFFQFLQMSNVQSEKVKKWLCAV